jgi:hypothetical protein
MNDKLKNQFLADPDDIWGSSDRAPAAQGLDEATTVSGSGLVGAALAAMTGGKSGGGVKLPWSIFSGKSRKAKAGAAKPKAAKGKAAKGTASKLARRLSRKADGAQSEVASLDEGQISDDAGEGSSPEIVRAAYAAAESSGEPDSFSESSGEADSFSESSGEADSEDFVAEGNDASEESPTPEQAFERRKERRENGALKLPDYDPALGYAPRKLPDTKHWAEGNEYFLPEVAASSGGYDVKTKYYNDEERANRRVGVNGDGLLTRANGKLLDTQKALAPMADGAKGGRHIFAMNQDDEMYTADAMGENIASIRAMRRWERDGKQGEKPILNMTHHSSFFAGESVDELGNYDFEADEGLKGAGEVGAKEGWLQRISNVSGHYLPDMKNTMATVQALEKQGLNTDSTKLDNIWYDDDGKHIDEHRVMALGKSGGNLAQLDAQKKAMAEIDAIGDGPNHLKPTALMRGPKPEEWWRQAYRDGEQG